MAISTATAAEQLGLPAPFALPAFLAVALFFINPEHMNLLFRERMGQMMLMGAIVMQTFGFLWIKKIVKIEV